MKESCDTNNSKAVKNKGKKRQEKKGDGKKEGREEGKGGRRGKEEKKEKRGKGRGGGRGGRKGKHPPFPLGPQPVLLQSSEARGCFHFLAGASPSNGTP